MGIITQKHTHTYIQTRTQTQKHQEKKINKKKKKKTLKLNYLYIRRYRSAILDITITEAGIKPIMTSNIALYVNYMTA